MKLKWIYWLMSVALLIVGVVLLEYFPLYEIYYYIWTILIILLISLVIQAFGRFGHGRLNRHFERKLSIQIKIKIK